KDGDGGLLKKIRNFHFFGIERIFERCRDVGDLRHENREQKNMSDVDLPGAPQDARTGQYEAALAHRAPIDEGCGVAGYENKDLGSVAKTVIPDRDPTHDVFRNMVEKDQPQRQPAEQIE